MSEGVKTIFFSGINGIGMSGLAKIMVTKIEVDNEIVYIFLIEYSE